MQPLEFIGPVDLTVQTQGIANHTAFRGSLTVSQPLEFIGPVDLTVQTQGIANHTASLYVQRYAANDFECLDDGE
ncbi:MAG: hypothetical protein OHK0013_26230 [Sandaracinaceae bacterium]